MENIVSYLRWLWAGLGAVLGFFLGGSDAYLLCLVVFVVCDYLSGVAVAIAQHELSSKVGFKGITRKAAIFIIVGLTTLLDAHILREGAAMRTAVIFFYIANEGLSIVENLAALGVPIPPRLEKALKALRDKSA